MPSKHVAGSNAEVTSHDTGIFCLHHASGGSPININDVAEFPTLTAVRVIFVVELVLTRPESYSLRCTLANITLL